LQNIFCNGLCDPAKAGVVLKHPNGDHLRLYFELGMFLQDGGAHKLVLGVKGDSGSKYYLLCKNEFVIALGEAGEESDDEIISTVIQRKQMALATDADILASVGRLEQRRLTCSTADFKLWEQATGLNYQPNGLLFNKALRQAGAIKPASQYCHDWMHGTCSSGVMSVCIFRLFMSLTAAGFPAWTLFAGYLALWAMPEAFSAKHLADLFSPKRMESDKKAKKFKCQASEVLALYPIMAHFVQSIAMKRGCCLPQCVAFLAMCDVMDLLQSVVFGIVSPQQLMQSVEIALQAFVTAGWAQYMTKKFH
jgi:hypothetical protein